jgi:acyl-coenzyme A thioesterase PaaI-like protein
MSIPNAAVQPPLQPLFPGRLGRQIADVGADRIVATTVARPDPCTSGGILHGGAATTFADTLDTVVTAVTQTPPVRG